MMKRSVFLIVASGLVASMALATPAKASPTYVITVTESLNITENDGNQNITGVALAFSGVNGTYSGVTIGPLMDPTSNANGTFFTGPPIKGHTEIPIVSSAGNTIDLTYATSVYSLGGTVSFKVTSTSDSVSMLQTIIKEAGLTVTPPPNSAYTIQTQALSFSVAAVPEPTSMALLGIGMTSFLAFRRFFKRGPVV
jgi:ABC-type proline/glycine betaine transport system substrate-binding protein